MTPLQLKLDDEICPSCGEAKNVIGVPLCFYCWYRSTVGFTKFFLLKVLSEQEDYLNLEEFLSTLNNHPLVNDGRKIFNENTVRAQLIYISVKGYKLVNAKKKVNGKRGRPKKLYAISKKRGVRTLNAYTKNWEGGFPVELKKSKYYSAHIFEIQRKARLIRGRVFKGIIGPYDYIFGNGLKNNPKFHEK